MSERIRELGFKHFRGLPDYVCTLNGKSLVVLGGNGKGKSAIVDGVEFLFAGRVGRFHGEGTGYVDPEEAIRHIQKKGPPAVEMHLTPTNGPVRRHLGSGGLSVPVKPSIEAYVASHPPVEAFILRRSQILDFVRDQDANRYRKFVQLLGLADIDGAQRAFVEAAQLAASQLEVQRQALARQLASFKDTSTGSFPADSAAVISRCSAAARAWGIENFVDWADLDGAIEVLEKKRWTEARAEIDKLTAVIASLQRPLTSELPKLVDVLNATHAILSELTSTSAEAQTSDVVREGLAFFENHADIGTCPLCQQVLQEGYAATLARLRSRNAALIDLRAAEARRREILERLTAEAKRFADQLADDLKHDDMFGPEDLKAIRDSRAVMLKWWRHLRRVAMERRTDSQQVPTPVDIPRSVRSRLAEEWVMKRDALIPPDAALLEGAIALFRNARSSRTALLDAEKAVRRGTALLSASVWARDAYSMAREAAIQEVFNHIAERVLSYYETLHDYGEGSEQSECTGLSLTPSSRAATGGLRLAIQFLGLADSSDPRAFLSEGHLDSLGLCLYLATVRLFNPTGSLLVLDDVMTSIDMEHRHRVAQLLFDEFSEYQLLITTHDEHWFSILQSSAHARGKQGEWRFNRIARWTLANGPETAAYEGTWTFIDAHLTEDSYRELGGPLRLVLEDFLKRAAAKLEVKVKFALDGKYTSGAFTAAGIHHEIREKLIEKCPSEAAGISQDVARVFGTGDLINILSHDNPGRLEVTLGQTKDFVTGLKSLIRRCSDNGLMKAVAG